MSYSQLLFLLMSSMWQASQQPPRPCASMVVIETESLLQWTTSGGGPEYPAELRSLSVTVSAAPFEFSLDL